jgi:hypothetical protein
MTAAPLSMLQQRCQDTDRAGMRRHDLGTMVVSKRWAENLLGRTGKKSQNELVEHCELSPYDAPLFDQALRSLAFGMDILKVLSARLTWHFISSCVSGPVSQLRWANY